MNKNNTLKNILITLSLSLLVLTLVSSSPIMYGQTTTNTQNSNNNSLPNFLVIVSDDLGFSDIGVFGSEISTPNLDKLANEGKILTNYHTMPVCSPARVSLLTGVDNHIGGIGTMYENIAPNQVGKPGYETYINNKVVTISELLKDAGYNTIMSGKWHLSGKGYKNGTTPYDRGFEESFSLLESGAQHFNSGEYLVGNPVTFVQNGKIVQRPDNTTYSNELYTNIMLESIKKFKDDGKPLFMYLSFQVAHSPFQAPQDYIKKYEGVYNVGYDIIREKRFDKQKELSIWSSDIQLPTRLPIDKPWSELTSDEQKYRTKVLQAHAAMIDNMDYNIGKVIDYLKEIGKYDNTLILFTSDNGSSEPVEMKNAATSGATIEQTQQFFNKFNNTITNIGNPDSLVNYGPWGTAPSVSPFSYFKTTQGEGGTRPPFVIKEPISVSSNNTQKENIVDSFVHVNDITPTILEYAKVSQPGPSYNGNEVHPIMGKSIKAVLEGKTDKVYNDDEPVAQEMFNNTAVYLGDWKAVKNTLLGDKQWKLFNITKDIGENNDLAKEHPEILQNMISDYDKFAKEVGVIIPNSQAEAINIMSTD